MSGPLPEAGAIDVFDVLAGVLFGLSFDSKGFVLPTKKRARRCRRVLERIPAASGYRPRRDGAVSLSPARRGMEQRWQQLSSTVQVACLACPLHARKECRGARFD